MSPPKRYGDNTRDQYAVVRSTAKSKGEAAYAPHRYAVGKRCRYGVPLFYGSFEGDAVRGGGSRQAARFSLRSPMPSRRLLHAADISLYFAADAYFFVACCAAMLRRFLRATIHYFHDYCLLRRFLIDFVTTATLMPRHVCPARRLPPRRFSRRRLISPFLRFDFSFSPIATSACAAIDAADMPCC